MASQPPDSLKEVRVQAIIADGPGEGDKVLGADVLGEQWAGHEWVTNDIDETTGKKLWGMTYERAADAMVRGCSICYARVESLRPLIEAVQAHPDAKLAPPQEEREEGWKPPDETGGNSLSELKIYGGMTQDSKCQDFDIRLTLVLSTCFKYDTSFSGSIFCGAGWFDNARFEREVWFRDTTFISTASFVTAYFAGAARFDKVHFNSHIRFGQAHYQNVASYSEAKFCSRATFDKARFDGEAIFSEVIYDKYASFDGVKFDKDVNFCSAEFKNQASFASATLSGKSSFDMTNFHGAVCFTGTKFIGKSSFLRAKFISSAEFGHAQFSNNAYFNRVCFVEEAWFGLAKFDGVSSFEGVRFKESAWFIESKFGNSVYYVRSKFDAEVSFRGASFRGQVSFAGAALSRYMDLTHLACKPNKLCVSWLDLQPGAAIDLDLEHLKGEDKGLRNPDEEPWMVERDQFSNWIASIQTDGSHLLLWIRWLLEYIDVVLWVRHPIRHCLGLGIRGDVIVGETADAEYAIADPDERHKIQKALHDASAQYNMLRDNFRTQPSTDEHEDLCHFRYKDLTRRAKWLGDLDWKRRIVLSIEWFLMRNVCGYMLHPLRIAVSGILLLFFFALIFGIFAGEGTITHNVSPTAQAAMEMWDRDPLNPLYFSLMTFVTLGYGDFAPLGLFKLLCGIEGLLGVTLLAMFTVAWGRKMIR